MLFMFHETVLKNIKALKQRWSALMISGTATRDAMIIKFSIIFSGKKMDCFSVFCQTVLPYTLIWHLLLALEDITSLICRLSKNGCKILRKGWVLFRHNQTGSSYLTLISIEHLYNSFSVFLVISNIWKRDPF